MSKKGSPTWLFTLSAIFEYYDFIVYGLMVSYIAQLFFPANDNFSAQMMAFSVFAIGYIARPLGALIWGMIGDLKGRRRAFINSNIFLGLTTIGISILPNYNQIGSIATILLVILRIVQAGSFAAELPGSMAIIKEEENTHKFSYVIAGTSIGALLASSAVFLIENYFTKEEILNYAWRLPFIFGSLLCFISILLRKKLQQLKEQNLTNKLDIAQAIFPQLNNIIYLVFLLAVPAFLVVMNIYFPVYISKFYQYSQKQVINAVSLSYLVAALYPIVFSYYINKKITNFEDIISVNRIIIFSAMVIGLFINFFLLRGGMFNLYLSLAIYQIINTSIMLLNFIIMAEIFPSEARFTLIAICYNITYLFISFSPILVTNFSLIIGSPLAMWLIFIILCLFALNNLNKISNLTR
jgi:MFS family permease